MIQICNEVITIPLKLIFDQSLKKGKFPEIWKVENVDPAHKKEDKSLVKIIVLSAYLLFLLKFSKE